MSTILFIHFKFSVNFVLLSNVRVACFKVAQLNSPDMSNFSM